MRVRWCLCGLLLLTLPGPLWANPPAPAPLAITFEDQAVVANGVTPNGQVAWFSVARESDDEHMATVTPRAAVVTDTGSGQVSFPLDQAVPFKSIWIAIDLASGDFTVAAPDGFPLNQVNWRGVGLLRGQGQADQMQDARVTAFVFVARPGVGAWEMYLADGGASDADGAIDGKLTSSLDQLQPIGTSPAAPTRFDPHDIVALIDPDLMEVILVHAGQPQ